MIDKNDDESQEFVSRDQEKNVSKKQEVIILDPPKEKNDLNICISAFIVYFGVECLYKLLISFLTLLYLKNSNFYIEKFFMIISIMCMVKMFIMLKTHYIFNNTTF